MKFKIGDVVTIINPRPKYCNFPCWNNFKSCQFHNQTGIIRDIFFDKKREHVWVVKLKSRDSSGCSAFIEEDVRLANKQEIKGFMIDEL